jgi:tetratricopeptide (TPR) repeat protein
MMSDVPVTQSYEIVRMERKLSAAMGAVPRDPGAAIAALEEAISLAGSSPEAAEWFVPAELLAELADEYEALGRTDDAIDAMRRALADGWHGRPDGRCRLAGILMHAGRVAEAERLWVAVRAETPEDVWLYHSAGVEYANLGEHETALRWLTDGLRLALRTNDADELAESLLEQRGVSLLALGRGFDDLQERAETFVISSVVQAARRLPGDDAAERRPVHAAARWAWFPTSEYARALRLWPELTADGGPAARGCDHATYCHRMQRRIREGAGALMVGVAIAPIHVETYLAWCDRHGEDPANATATFAAALPPEELIAWPPGRNDACWCRSGRKYKRCCGQPGAE